METEAQRADVIRAGQAPRAALSFRRVNVRGRGKARVLQTSRSWFHTGLDWNPSSSTLGPWKAAPCLGFFIYRLNKRLHFLRQLERWNEIMWALLISPERSGTKWLILVEHAHPLDPRATSSPTSGFYWTVTFSVRPSSLLKRPTPPQLSLSPSLIYHQLIY